MKFSTKKMGVNFFLQKRPNRGGGGGPGGGLVKDHTFAAFFFVHPSLRYVTSPTQAADQDCHPDAGSQEGRRQHCADRV